MSKTSATRYVQLCLFPDWLWAFPRHLVFTKGQQVGPVRDSDLAHLHQKDEQVQAAQPYQICLFSLEE